MTIITLDIEASGFGKGSYPIEVGFALASGESHCMLIRPEPDWQHWDEQAELCHGINRQTLVTYGKSIADVAEFLNRYLIGEWVYCDAWGHDSSWLSLLFHTAAIEQAFKLESIAVLLDQEQQAIWHETKDALLQKLGLARHRASSDAKLLQQTWQQVEALSLQG